MCLGRPCQRGVREASVGSPWGVQEASVPVGCLRGVRGLSVECPCGVCGVRLGRPWCVLAASVGCPWGCSWGIRGASVGCPWDTNSGVRGVPTRVCMKPSWGVWCVGEVPMGYPWGVHVCSNSNMWAARVFFRAQLNQKMHARATYMYIYILFTRFTYDS